MRKGSARGSRVTRRDRRLHAGRSSSRGRRPRRSSSGCTRTARRHEAGSHPLRRHHLGRRPDHGRRHHRGLADDLFDVTTTFMGADAVTAWSSGGMRSGATRRDRQRHRSARGGPPGRRREKRWPGSPRTRTTSAEDAFEYLDAKQLDVAGVPCLALRIGFVGELGYELHFPSPAGKFLWDSPGRGRRAPVRPRAAARAPAREGRTSSWGRTPTRSRTCFPPGCRGSRSWRRTTSSASSRSSTSGNATSSSGWSGSTMEDDVPAGRGRAGGHRGAARRTGDERAPERGGRPP